MRSELRTFSYPGGEIQRVQLVRFENWADLDFLHPVPTTAALGCFSEIYDLYLVPARPWMFGTFVMFTVPEGMEVPFPRDTKKYGALADELTVAAAALQQGVKFVGDSPRFVNETIRAFWTELEKKDCLRIMNELTNQYGFEAAVSAMEMAAGADSVAAIKVFEKFYGE